MPTRRAVLLIVLMLAFLGFGVLYAAWELGQPSPRARSATVLHFDVPSELEESLLPFFPLSLSGIRPQRMTVWDVLRGLRQASRDPAIEALVLHLGSVDWGWAKVEEVREAITSFRASGKRVYASLEGGGDREYLLASAANRICVPPTVTLQLDGLEVSALFYRGAFDKFGISPNFRQVGRYKSAVETYTRTGMSAPSREALDAVLDDHEALLVDSLAAARGVPRDSMRGLLTRGPFDAPEALEAGLIDTLLHPSDVDSLALSAGARPRTELGFARYLDRLSDPRGGARIALVVASGTIAAGRSRESPTEGRILGAESLIDALREARERRGIRAIVLRVDSPGGDADASDEIWREVARCRERKPVIVSMSDLAASGGYYVAVAGESLVAHPATLTGSIGAFGGKLNIAGLLHKLGVGIETVTRGPHALMLSPYEDFTPEEGAIFRRHLDHFYRRFLDRVAEGRHLDPAAVDSAASGRVWTGLAARRLGLVDRLGGLEDALRMARIRAGLPAEEEAPVAVFPRPWSPWLSRWLGDLLREDDPGTEGRESLPPVLRAWWAASRFPSGEVLALMPWSIDIR